MFRRNIIRIHLYLAAFLAPLFLLVAWSGGLYLLGQKGEVTRTVITLPADASLDLEGDTLAADVRALLHAAGEAPRIESVSVSGGIAQTRPRSRTNYQLQVQGGTVEATRIEPNFQKTLVELHKGHAPIWYRNYQKLAALGLAFVVLSGAWLGLSASTLRRQSLIASGLGLVTFIVLAFVV